MWQRIMVLFNMLYNSSIWMRLGLFLLYILILFLVFQIIVFWLLKKMEKIAAKTKTDLDDFAVQILKRIQWPVYFVLVLFSAYYFFSWSVSIKNFIKYAIILYVVYECIQVGVKTIDYFVSKVLEVRFKEKKAPQMAFLKVVLKILVWLVGLLFALSNLGYNVNSLVTSLGIGGIAVALAVQNILSDIFSSITIFLDKPFKVGDYISFGDASGTVKTIGIKTTRITTPQGQELVVSNRELVNSKLNNFGKMKRRRVTFRFGVTYQTSLEKINQIKQDIKDIFDKYDDLSLVRIHFINLGDSALEFELTYYVENNDYGLYLDRQEALNLEIMGNLEKQKVDFAYPTQTIYLQK